MIKFFKKVRLNSLTENKVSTYVLYATGEIILVVIGILIAIQLNSLNELKKIEKKRNDLVGRLVKQIEFNRLQVNESIEELEFQIKGITAVMQNLGTPKLHGEPHHMDSLMSFVIEDHHLGLDITILQEALQNGELSVLDDNDLRTSLYSLLKYNERLQQREEIANYDNNNFMIPYLYKNLNSRNVSANINPGYRNEIGYSKLKPNEFDLLFNEREFENLVESRYYYAQEMMANYIKMRDFLELLGNMLLKE